MRLRRRADAVRAIGWINLGGALLITGIQQDAWSLMFVWAVAAMGLTHALAHLVDKRAERVIGR